MLDLISSVVVVAIFVVAFILNIKKSPKSQSPAPKKFVTYHSNKHGERLCEILARKNGHFVLHVREHPPGVTVNRRVHLCASVN